MDPDHKDPDPDPDPGDPKRPNPTGSGSATLLCTHFSWSEIRPFLFLPFSVNFLTLTQHP